MTPGLNLESCPDQLSKFGYQQTPNECTPDRPLMNPENPPIDPHCPLMDPHKAPTDPQLTINLSCEILFLI
jgi:hypothetical protein